MPYRRHEAGAVGGQGSVMHWLLRLTPGQIVGKVRRRVLPNLGHLGKTRIRRCRCCARVSIFLQFGDTEEFRICARCGANLRYEMLAEYIRETFPDLDRRTVWELDPLSPLQPLLERSGSYVRTFYDPSLPVGALGRHGAVMQDVTNIAFPDRHFDLIISSDVLEHVPDADKAFSEIFRVLKPGGVCAFTVPPHEKTVRRAYIAKDGALCHIEKPEYHSDPLNPDGILAFWSFGLDMPALFSDSGLIFHVAKGPESISRRIVWETRRPVREVEIA